MVRHYKRKTSPAYTLETLKQAVAEVKNGVLNSYQASRKYNIPRTTITDRVNQRRGTVKETRGRPTTINEENEKRLASGLHTMEKYGFGLSSQETTDLVTKFVKCNRISNNFKNDTPGYDWLAGFLKRNNLSLKKPQAVEMSRKAACDPFIIEEYFDTLENCIIDMKLVSCPEKIWNLDESSFSKDPEKTKVVGARGYASTRTIASAGKDNVTVLFTANALGEKLPPLIIYRGKNVWDKWMSAQAYENTIYAATKNGWIESKVFAKYMLEIVLPHISKDAPCLLIYDGHSTHIQLNILEEAKKIGVTILKLPSHASHLLQPLDLAVFKSMKDKWDAKILAWQRLNVGAKLQKDQFSEILGEVWKELDPKIIRNGFKKGGVYPLNKNAIPQDKFDPASLKRFNEAKSKKDSKPKARYEAIDIPYLSSLCLQTINNDNEKKNLTEKLSPAIDNTFFKLTDVIIPGTSKGTTKIQIIEDRIIKSTENKSFEDLLLTTIKKADLKIKTKKTKVSKGCDIITREEFIEKLRKEQSEKEKKCNIKKCNIKKCKTIKEKPKKNKPNINIKKLQKKIQDSSEESCGEDKLLLNDSDSSEDWDTYCKTIIQDNQEVDNYCEEKPSQRGCANEKTDCIQNDGYEPDPIRRHLKVDDWIIVKFTTKKTIKHFVGNIISLNPEKIPKVKFLRKNKNSKIQAFHYPNVEDIADIIHYADIVMFLKKPQITRRGYVIFTENFKAFNIQ